MGTLKQITSQDLLRVMTDGIPLFGDRDEEANTLYVHDIDLSESLTIRDLDMSISIAFCNCHFRGGVEFHGGTFQGISFNGGRITKPVMVYGGEFFGKFKINQVNALEMDGDGLYSFAFMGGTFKSSIEIYKGAFQKLCFGAARAPHLTVKSGAVSSFNQGLEPGIKQLYISVGYIDIMEFHDVSVNDLSLAGFLDKGVYAFNGLQVTSLAIENLVNLGQIHVSELTVCPVPPVTTQWEQPDRNAVSTLRIAHATLGAFLLSDLDLRNFQTIDIRHSNLTTIHAANVSWFDPPQISALGDLEQRDLYRQLKQAMIAQGNRIDEMRFHELEMTAYLNTLSYRKNFWDLVVLNIGRHTNRFGTDYIRPALLLVCTAVLFFLGSVWILGLSPFEKWGSLFVMLNPAHASDYLLPKAKLPNAFLAWDFLGRLCNSVLIFQFLTGFRKFIRR